MRLYSMYFICKNNINEIESIKESVRNTVGSPIKYLAGWDKTVITLNKLASVPCLRASVEKMYESVPVVYRDKARFDFDNSTYDNFFGAKKELLARMNTVIDLYENSHGDSLYDAGFDIRLPEFKTMKELAKCMNDIEFIVNQCPFLNKPDSEIKYKTADVGSFWLTFAVVGTSASVVLLNLSKIVEAAIRIKSHVATVKQQEEVLRSMELRNDIAADVIDSFKKVNKVITDRCVNELEAELGELPNREDADKAGKSIELLAGWIDKGLQIYSAIDAPDEVKALFPAQEEQPLLNDDVIKLLEAKSNASTGGK